ncbi:hypothetical protein ACWDMR_32710 [Streptomyces althioticus]|uniref:hypothetical protein n=1 Tax=Streptomyces TaxID=1883 RepID=UPI00073AAAEF|nr:hypothetical protein [Streptomyces lusitanus]ALV48205.1 hypothetical protein ASR50_01395 [Streptomyces sp. 4F]MCC9690541.1 hypothetical protein [Streptomyces sp. MNU103]
MLAWFNAARISEPLPVKSKSSMPSSCVARTSARPEQFVTNGANLAGNDPTLMLAELTRR